MCELCELWVLVSKTIFRLDTKNLKDCKKKSVGCWKRFSKQVISIIVCLDGERISVRIILFGLVVENSVRLVIFREM
jgi:hypothetical protein